MAKKGDLVLKPKAGGKTARLGTIWENEGANGPWYSISVKYDGKYHGSAPAEVQKLIKYLERLTAKDGPCYFNFYPEEEDRPNGRAAESDFLDDDNDLDLD